MHRSVITVSTAACLALLALSGCPDPEGKFNEFNDKTADARKVVLVDTGQGSLADVSGTFLLSISPSIAPSSYLQFTSTNTFTANDDPTTGGKLVIDLQPIATAPGKATREPVGTLIHGEADVDANGAFEMDLGVQDVVGDANPISGSAITATLKLIGSIKSEDLMCGSIEGDVTAPLQAPLAGSTFGFIRIEKTDAATLPEPVAVCPKETGGPDAGGTDASTADVADAGPTDDAADAGDVVTGPPACPGADLSGTYTIQFITDLQKTSGEDPRTLALELTADATEGICYTGSLLSTDNPGEQLATISSVVVDGETVIFTASDFQIPPGASAILPNGGVADVHFTGTLTTVDRMCGTIDFALREPAISSPGVFAMSKDDGPFSVAGPDCETGFAPRTPAGCAFDSLAGAFQLKFITDTQKGQGAPPSDLILALEPAATAGDCLKGGLLSKLSPGEQLATITAVTADGDGFSFTAENFEIPPGANILLPDGGKANVTFTAGAEKKTDDTFCGTIVFSLFEPFALDSNGSFAAARHAVADAPTEPTCDGVK